MRVLTSDSSDEDPRLSKPSVASNPASRALRPESEMAKSILKSPSLAQPDLATEILDLADRRTDHYIGCQVPRLRYISPAK